MFSHGLSATRMLYSCLYMELASCGYFVVCLTHKDKSADYHPEVGPFDCTNKAYNYDLRNKQVKQRELELLQVCKGVMAPDFLAN